MEQELTLPENLSSHPVFIGVHVTRTLVICVYFADRFNTESIGNKMIGTYLSLK
jgi:hypothetical protein